MRKGGRSGSLFELILLKECFVACFVEIKSNESVKWKLNFQTERKKNPKNKTKQIVNHTIPHCGLKI